MAERVLTAAEFAARFPSEGSHIELKQGISSQRIAEAVTAFSNTSGGEIVLGVKPDGQFVGLNVDGEAQRKVHQAIGEGVRNPGRYTLSVVRVGDRTGFVLRVQERDEGFAQLPDGRVLVRRGAMNPALLGDPLVDFIQSRASRRFERSPAPLRLTQAEPSCLDALREAWGWSGDVPERMRENGLTSGTQADTDPHLTVAGALFSVADPSLALGGKQYVECFRYRDEGAVEDLRITIKGPLPEQIRRTVEWIQQQIGRDVYYAGLNRVELDRLPEKVLRETVSNAVAHRTYEDQRRPIRVIVRPNRVEVTSPGPLPVPVTVENIREQNAPRNINVIATLRRFHLAEDAGMGIDIIQDQMSEHLLEAPAFKDDGTSVTVVLPLARTVSQDEYAWITRATEDRQVLPTDRVLLVAAARGEELTNRVARTLLHSDSTEARASLQRLCQIGLLVQEGERSGARYRLADALPALSSRRTVSESDLQEAVLKLVALGPIANADVRQALELDRLESLRLLNRMVSQGKLRRSGAKRGTRYELPDQEGQAPLPI